MQLEAEEEQYWKQYIEYKRQALIMNEIQRRSVLVFGDLGRNFGLKIAGSASTSFI